MEAVKEKNTLSSLKWQLPIKLAHLTSPRSQCFTVSGYPGRPLGGGSPAPGMESWLHPWPGMWEAVGNRANVWPKCPLTMGFHSFALVFNIPFLIWINQKSRSLHQGVNMSKINFLNFCDHSRWLRKWGLRHPEGTSLPPSAHWVWPTGSLRARLVCEDYNA